MSRLEDLNELELEDVVSHAYTEALCGLTNKDLQYLCKTFGIEVIGSTKAQLVESITRYRNKPKL